MRSRHVTGVLSASLLIAVPSASVAGWAKSGGWTVSRSAAGCGIANAPPALPLSLSQTETDQALLRFTLASGKLPPNQPFALALDQATGRVTISGEAKADADGRSGELLAAGDLRTALSTARKVEVVDSASGKRFGSVNIADTAAALSIMARCLREVALSDPGSGLPATVPPTPRWPLHVLIKGEDYPFSALRDEASGTAVLSLMVSAKGRVSDCQTVRTSGRDDLDEASCRYLGIRARFTPATDNGGAATEAVVTHSVTWRIPE